MAWFVTAGGKKVKVTECRVAASNGEAPGTVLSTKPLTVACADGAVQLLHVVPEAKSRWMAPPLQPVCASKRGIPSDGGQSAGSGSGCTGPAGAGRLLKPCAGCRTPPPETGGRDKAFAGAIFYTVLEHQGTLDFILEQFLPKGLARLDPQVREILRAALAQARYMQVPVSAAVNEAVKLTRTFKKASASGLVNAVLRKACNYDLETARFRNETQRSWCWALRGRMWQSSCAPITPRKRWAS